MKKLFLIVLLNGVLLSTIFELFAKSTSYYCGLGWGKPIISLKLEPTWFDQRFQLNRGHTEIIGSTKKNSPSVDKWVRGTEQYKTITAYYADNESNVAYFNGIDFDGENYTFLIKQIGANYHVEKINKLDINFDDSKWKYVDFKNCQIGFLKFFLYLLSILIILFDILAIKKHIKNNRFR